MSEETGTTEAITEQVTTEATPAAVSTPQSYIDGQGNFTDGWLDNYVPEDVRNEAIFGRMKSIQGMTKTLANFERMKGSGTIPQPSDKFGDSDWDDFHRAGGWTGEAIPLTAPEGLPEGVWSDDRATKYSEAFNQLRLNPKQIAGIMELHGTDLAEQMTNLNNSNETSMAELKAGLLSEWGNAYTQKEHLANFTVEKGTKGDVEFKDRLLQKFGSDPDFIRYNANLGGDFSESGSIPTINQAPTPVDIQGQINEIMNSEAFSNPLHPGHADAMKNKRRLHIEKGKIRQPA